MGITGSQAARVLGVSSRTVANWADQGKLAAKRSAGGWRLFDPEDVARLKREMENRTAH